MSLEREINTPIDMYDLASDITAHRLAKNRMASATSCGVPLLFIC